jgi:hypothetical protein
MYLPHLNSAYSKLPNSKLSITACRRLDMTTPLAIFGGLFLAAVAICGTLDAHSPVISSQDNVIHAENVVGPADINLVSNCHRKNNSGLETIAAHQCSGATSSSNLTQIH